MKNGFGDRNNFFLGLENIHKKCPTIDTCNLVILAEFFDGLDISLDPNKDNFLKFSYLKLDNFYIKSEEEKYEIVFSGSTEGNTIDQN